MFDFSVYAISPKTPEAKQAAIAFIRDRLLAESHWTVLPDAPLTTAQRVLWQAYREALQVIEFSFPNPDDTIIPAAPVFVNAPPSVEITDFRTNRTQLRTDFQTAVDRLLQIENAVSPTNAQVVQAVKDIAHIERLILRLLARLV